MLDCLWCLGNMFDVYTYLFPGENMDGLQASGKFLLILRSNCEPQSHSWTPGMLFP